MFVLFLQPNVGLIITEKTEVLIYYAFAFLMETTV